MMNHRHNPYRNLTWNELVYGAVLVLAGCLVGFALSVWMQLGYYVLLAVGFAYASAERNPEPPVAAPPPPAQPLPTKSFPFRRARNGRWQWTIGSKNGKFASQADVDAWRAAQQAELRRQWNVR